MRRTRSRVVAVLGMAVLLLGAAARVEAARRYSPGPQRLQSRSGGGWDRRSFGHHGGHRGGSFRHHGGFRHHGHTSFFFGFGAGALATAPFWAYPRVYAAPVYAYPYPVQPYPAYSYPAYPYPPYAYPPPGYGPPPPAGAPPPSAPGGTTPTPEPVVPSPGMPAPGSAPSGAGGGESGGSAADAPQAAAPTGPATAAPESGSRCHTVTVVGHWQSRIYPDGQRMTVWVPTATRSVCQ